MFCGHYNRGCGLWAPCCKRTFPCHVCHNQATRSGNVSCGEHLDPRCVVSVECMECNNLQPAPDSGMCICCGQQFGKQHACELCHIYSHDKDMWHCNRCGICRLGRREEFQHCGVCDVCVPTDTGEHQCAPNAMHYECVVCRTYLFRARERVAPLPGCRHLAVCSPCLGRAQERDQELDCPHCEAQRRGEQQTSSLVNSSGFGALEIDGLLETLRLQGWSGEEATVYRDPLDVYKNGQDTSGEYARMFNRLPAQVLPSDQEEDASSAAVNLVYYTLQHLPNTRVDRVHKGGSFGRKTRVRGRFDVDMLVFVNNFNPADEEQAGRILGEAKAALVARTGAAVKERPHLTMLKLEVEGVEMDVPLVCNLAKGPADPDKALAQRRELVGPLLQMSDVEILDMAARPPDRARERAVGEALTEFVKRQQEKEHRAVRLNDAVRLFKAWVKCGLAELRLLNSNKLPSIALELIVLAAWQQEVEVEPRQKAQGDLRFTRELLLRVFMRSLRLACQLTEAPAGDSERPEVIMLDAGPDLGYRRAVGMRFRPCWGPSGPFIIHPIDPSCNVARVPDNDDKPPWDWSGLAKQARVLLTILEHCSLGVLLRESTLGAALYRLRHGLGPK